MDELRVVITADASGVAGGVAAATAAVQSSADQIAAAQLKATAATKALTEAQIQLGAAAEGGNAQAQGIIAEYAAASAAAAVSVEELTSAVAAQNPVMVENAAATSAAAAATNVLGVSARQGAAAGIGILEGRMMSGNRAAAAFLSTTLGLGPVIQAAFPVIGALALLEVIGQIGEATYKAFDLGGDAAREFQVKLADLAGSYRTLQDETSLEADKIEAANAKLEHVPYPNAAKEAIDEALVEADKMDSKLAGLIEKEESLLKMQGIAGSKTQQVLGITPGSKDEIQDLQQHAIWMEKAVSLEGELAESKSFTAVEQGKLNSLNEKEASYEATVKSLGGQAEKSDYIESQIQATEILVSDTEKETAAIQDQMRVRDAATKHEQLTATPRVKAEDYENEAAALKAQGANLGEIVLFWEKVNEDGKHYEQVLRAQEELTRQIAGRATIKGEGGDTGKDLVQPPDIANAAGLGGKQQTPEEMAQQADSAAEQIVESKERIYQQNLRNIDSEERLGLITEHEAAQQELALQRAAEKAESAPLASRQQAIAPLGRTGLDEQQLKEYDDLQKKMDQIAQQGALRREQIQRQEATVIEQTMKRVATTFSTDFEHAFNEWATKSKTAGQAFGAMLGQMELQVIDFAIKTVLEHAAMWAELKIENALGNETLKAQNALTNIQQIAQDAKTSAANAYKWASAWGGPVAGAAAAAVAFTAVEAFGVFDTGGMMPHMGFAMNTSGSPERILSPSQTANFESMVNNGGSSRSAVLHQTNNFSGGVNSDMLKEHRQQTLSDMRRLLRPEAFA